MDALDNKLAQQRAAEEARRKAEEAKQSGTSTDEVEITRQFWMYCREDLRKLKRITLLWDYIREVTEQNRPLLMGDSRSMLFAAP